MFLSDVSKGIHHKIIIGSFHSPNCDVCHPNIHDVMYETYVACHILNYAEDESWTAFHIQRLSGSLKM